MFDLESMLLSADDSFVTRSNKSVKDLIKDIEKSLEGITKLLIQSKLNVNQAKANLCLFNSKKTGLQPLLSSIIL
jgi:hypothetical protein